MRTRQLLRRGLTFYWRTHLAVVLGVATAVAVLAGALLVGDSVRGSLRDLVLGRLGATDHVVASAGFFREQLGEDMAGQAPFKARFAAIVPLVAVQGMVTEQDSGRRAGQVRVYGVDDRFWAFHGVAGVHGPAGRDVFVSEALADQLGAREGGALLVRVQRPTDLPLESLHSRKDDLGRTLRLTVREVLPASSLGEFSLEAQQGEVRAAFVPIALLQEQMEVPGRVNALLVSAHPGGEPDAVRALEQLAATQAQLDDVGLRVSVLETRGALAVTSDSGLLDDAHAAVVQEAVRGAGLEPEPVFTYLANTLRACGRVPRRER